MTEQLKAHPDCFLLDELGFQIGAVANVTGAYAADWPEPVRILGIEKYRHGKINITIGTLDGDEPTDGFGIDDINPHPRRRTDDRASIIEEAAKSAIGDAGDALDFALDHIDDTWSRTDFLESWREGDLAEWPEYTRWLEVQRQGALRNLAPNPSPEPSHD
jgi:hypothetical protein